MGETRNSMASQGLGQDQCGSRDEAGLVAAATLSFNEEAVAKGHVLKLTEDGDIDIFVCDSGHHNGPGCSVCADNWCHHCTRPADIKPCDGGVQQRDYAAKARVRDAAPDLLAALQAVLPGTLIGESYDPPIPDDELLKEFLFTWGKLRAARAAVAKALGGEA